MAAAPICNNRSGGKTGHTFLARFRPKAAVLWGDDTALHYQKAVIRGSGMVLLLEWPLSGQTVFG
jgi:hypothetical protein